MYLYRLICSNAIITIYVTQKIPNRGIEKATTWTVHFGKQQEAEASL